ncbi:MAG: ROK family protein [Eubacteriales bacterium]|nr:ROK family protein [Eubacteriales bacterium]
MMFYAIAIDIGGTNIKYGLVDSSGRIVYKSRRPSGAEKGAPQLIINVKKVIGEVLERYKDIPIHGIGIGSAGQIDHANGMVLFATPNIPGYTAMCIKGIIESEMGIDTFVENDVNASAIGEAWKGAAGETGKILCITIGTGVGGCIMFDGKIEKGISGSAGEIGHMVVKYDGLPCNCGNRGCLEQYASAASLVKSFESRMNNGEASSAVEMLKHGEKLDARLIFNIARNGDALALSVIDSFANYLGIGLVSLIHVLNPGLIIIGGGVSNDSDLYLSKVCDYVNSHAMPSFLKGLRIIPARLGNDAGIIGAAKLVFDNKGNI